MTFDLWRLSELMRANQWERASRLADRILDAIKATDR